ncbi:MAG: hypothetical protein WBA05_01355 [Gordonia sp. (in: high G+C Gram-positive bacteria)]|uniref:hypothetical protein n=1 Tax=Gordonia sp. (in: high G+C Gram-positive bacteria) TaxID=84139 RepID=UPI003C78409E
MPARETLPILNAGTPVLVRAGNGIHIGSDPRTALTLDFAPPVSAARLVRVLQRLRSPQRYPQVRREVRAAGMTATAFWALLDSLVAAGKATAPADDRRRALRVGVVGHGELAELLLAGLPADGHRTAACDPRGPLGPLPGRPDLVVIADQPVADPAMWRPLMQAGVPHLSVHVDDDVGIVGPLVLPGMSSCLQCIEHFRTDRDPQWPVLAAALQGVAGGASVATRLSTVALAHAHLADIADRLRASSPVPPATVNTVIEFGRRPCVVRSIPAPLHPRCRCVPGHRGEPVTAGSSILELAAKGHN